LRSSKISEKYSVSPIIAIYCFFYSDNAKGKFIRNLAFIYQATCRHIDNIVILTATTVRNSNTLYTATVHAGDLVGAIAKGENYMHKIGYNVLLFPETIEEENCMEAYFRVAAVGVNTKHVGISLKNLPTNLSLYTCID
jgi:hypothetical protein